MMTPDYQTTREQLITKIKLLSRHVWNGECEWEVVDSWLQQFSGDGGATIREERLQMLFLLTNFLYFGTREIRELLRSVYRDLFRSPVIHDLRRKNNNTRDAVLLRTLFQDELERTRFLPIGNPSESSAHLLYYFRQENHLSKRHFLSAHEIFHSGRPLRTKDPSIRRYVFLDDFAGSGDQALAYATDLVDPLQTDPSPPEAHYYVLFATTTALSRLRTSTSFARVESVFEIGDDFRAFSNQSLYYTPTPNGISQSTAKRVANHYGNMLCPQHPFGYDNGQLLLGFSHNVPDNTLPIFWHSRQSRPRWLAPFPRHPKF